MSFPEYKKTFDSKHEIPLCVSPTQNFLKSEKQRNTCNPSPVARASSPFPKQIPNNFSESTFLCNSNRF